MCAKLSTRGKIPIPRLMMMMTRSVIKAAAYANNDIKEGYYYAIPTLTDPKDVYTIRYYVITEKCNIFKGALFTLLV